MAKLLVIGKYYEPFSGGIEEVTRLVSEYAALRHDVTVLVHNHERGASDGMMNGVRVIRQPVEMLWKGQPISLRMFSGVNLADYEMINFHSPNPFVTAHFMLRTIGRRPPIVVTHHMDIYGRKLLRAFSLPFLHWLAKAAAAVIVTSSKNLHVSADLPRGAAYRVVPLGVDERNYVIDGQAREEARRWRRERFGDVPLIGFIGRIARYKGLGVLMEALRELADVHVAIAGAGAYLEEVRATAERLGVASRVHLLGRVDHATKLNLLSSIDAFVFPSTEITEAFGLSQVEAMLCGAPVVASDLPTGVTDVSIDRETALLATPGDAASLAGAIRLMLSDRALAERLAADARRHVLANMTARVVAERTLAIFEEVVAQRPRG